MRRSGDPRGSDPGASVYPRFEALALVARVLPHRVDSGVPVRGGNIPGRIPEILSQKIPPGTRPDVGQAATGV